MKYYGGIDLGGTNSKIGLLNEKGELIFSLSIKTESEKGYLSTVQRISNEFKGEVLKLGINYDDVVSVGFGVPGPVINKSTIVSMSNFSWPNNLNIAVEFEKELRKPVYLDNDVNVITLGELWVGAAKGYKDVLGVALGTGIGAGIVVDRKVVSGKNGAAGELGHIPLVKNGRLCGCGKKGCFEAYASATAIARVAKDSLIVNKDSILHEIAKNKEIESKDVFMSAKKGDKLSLDIVEETAKYLALGLSTALSITNSDVVVIGGGVALAGDFLLNKVKEYMKDDLLTSIYDDLEIKLAKLGDEAGIYGAAYLAMQSINN